MISSLLIANRDDPPRYGEGDHAKHGRGVRGVVRFVSAIAQIMLGIRLGRHNGLTRTVPVRTPPPPFGWSPSPCRGGSAL